MRSTVSERGRQLQRVAATGVGLIGLGFVVAPVPSGRFWDVEPDAGPAVPYLLRILGASQMGIGAAAALAEGRARPDVLRATAAAGGLTATSAVVAGLRGGLSRRGTLMAVVAAGGLGAMAWAAAES